MIVVGPRTADRFRFLTPQDCILELEKYTPAGKTAYVRWTWKCDGYAHNKCQKRRSAALNATHGAIEPIGYLAVWYDLGADAANRADHCPTMKPTAAMIAAWIETEGARFLLASKIDLASLPYISDTS